MSTQLDADVDVARELLDSLAHQCEVLAVYVHNGRAVRGERCPNVASWIVRSWCHCGRGAIDLVCDKDLQILPGLLHRCEACNCMTPPARRTVEPL